MLGMNKNRSLFIYGIVILFLLMIPFVYDSRTLLILLTQVFIFAIFVGHFSILKKGSIYTKGPTIFISIIQSQSYVATRP